MCGIYGFVGGPKKTANLQKILILGIMNETRGRDSCGLFTGTQIKHGWRRVINTQDNSVFRDFAATRHFTLSKRNTTVIGHNRTGSIGNKYALTSAHPFLYYENKEIEAKFAKILKDGEEGYYYSGGNVKPDMVLAMNGTLKDLTEYGVYASKLGEAYDFTKRWDNDSKMLGDIIFKEGFDVLNWYVGEAALAFSFPKKDPHSLYLWSGGYKNDASAQNLTRERPLHYLYSEEDCGFYFSSEESPLQVINNEGGNVEVVPMNTLLKFSKGELVESTHFEERDKSLNTPTPNPNGYTAFSNQKGKSGRNDCYDGYFDYEEYSRNDYSGGTYNEKKSLLPDLKELEDIEKEKRDESKDFIQFRKGIYYRWNSKNEKTVGGFWTVADGHFICDKQGYIKKPFECQEEGVRPYSFYSGYRLKELTEHARTRLVALQNTDKTFSTFDLNNNLGDKSLWRMKNATSNIWYTKSANSQMSGRLLDGEFVPLFTETILLFKNGLYLGKKEDIENKKLKQLNSIALDLSIDLLRKPVAESIKECFTKNKFVLPTFIETNGQLNCYFFSVTGSNYQFHSTPEENFQQYNNVHSADKAQQLQAINFALDTNFMTLDSAVTSLKHDYQISSYNVDFSFFTNVNVSSFFYDVFIFFSDNLEWEKNVPVQFKSFQKLNKFYVETFEKNNYENNLLMDPGKLFKRMLVADVDKSKKEEFVNELKATFQRANVKNITTLLDPLVTKKGIVPFKSTAEPKNVNLNDVHNALSFFGLKYLSVNSATQHLYQEQVQQRCKLLFGENASFEWGMLPREAAKRIINEDKDKFYLRKASVDLNVTLNTLEDLENVFYRRFNHTLALNQPLDKQLTDIAMIEIAKLPCVKHGDVSLATFNKEYYGGRLTTQETYFEYFLHIFDVDYDIFENINQNLVRAEENKKTLTCSC